MKKLLCCTAILFATGCASNPDKMGSTYVSPMQYRDYDCGQIATEMTNISRRSTQLHGQLKKDANNDAVQMGVGLVLFWPTLFFLEGGDGPQAAEYQELKGRKEALESVAIEKKCDVSMMPKFVEEPEPKKQAE